MDLRSLESAYTLTQQLSEDYPAIHYVFANAGTTPLYNLTEEGLEDAFGGMHLAHMVVVLGLLPSLKRGGEMTGEPSRVLMVSSEMAINRAIGVFGGSEPLISPEDVRGEHIRGDGTLTNSLPAYARAKLCNVLFARELNRRLANAKWPVLAHAIHPGAVVTDSSRDSIKKIFRNIPGLTWLVGNFYFPLLWRSVEGGAHVLLCAALSNDDYVIRGGQYLDALCHPFIPVNEQTNIKDTDDIDSIHLRLGRNQSLMIFKDPIQALLLADGKWSGLLWDISMSLIENSPAKGVVALAP